MADPGAALQKAVLGALSAGLSVPVYDAVPQGAAFPYVSLDSTVTDSADFLRERLDDTFMYINAWSESRGQEHVLRLIGEINSLLNGQTLVLDDGVMVSMRVVSKAARRDADNVTYMGNVTLRIRVQY